MYKLNTFAKKSSSKRKPVKPEIEAIDLSEIRRVITACRNARDRALLAVLYATGARVGEIETLETANITEEDFDGIRCLVFNVDTEKRKRKIMRLIPVRYDKEAWLIEAMKGYIDLNKGRELLFGIKQRQIRTIVHKYFGVHPHVLRHSRATHLVRYFQMNTISLTNIMGWSSAQMAMRYVHQNVSDVVNAFK